jgi:hypothetical protein
MGFALIARTKKALGANGGTTDAIDTTGANFARITASWYSNTEFGLTTSPTISDSKSNGAWNGLTTRTSANTNQSQRQWWILLTSVGSGHTFTISGNSGYIFAEVEVFSGAAASPFGGENGAVSNSASSLQPGSVTPDQDNCLITTGVNAGACTSLSINSGFSAESLDVSVGVNIAGGGAYLIQGTAAAVNPTWSWTGTEDGFAASIAWFKPDVSLESGDLTVTSSTATSINLAVTAATGGTGTKNYQLQRAPDAAGSPGTYANIGASQVTLTWSNTGLTGGTTYWYRVVTTDDVESVNSNEVSAVVEPSPGGDCEWVLDVDSIISSTESGAGFEATKLYDDDFSTAFVSSAATNGWAGIDLGSSIAAEPTAVLFAPKAASEEKGPALEVEWADTSGGSWTSVDTTFDRYPSREYLNRHALSPGVSKRCWRVRQPLDELELSELRWQGTWLGGINWRPSRPVFTPAAGRYAAGQSITLASSTTNASIYYTAAEGSLPADPDDTDTLYSGAISLPAISSGETYYIKAIAKLNSVYSAVVTAKFNPAEFVPDAGVPAWGGTRHAPQDWFDDEGRLIEAHGGDILYDPPSGNYYWYGAFGADNDLGGIMCYSSTDLLNWNLEGRVAAAFTGTGNGGPFESQTRLHPIYNPSPIDPDRKYVILGHGWADSSNDVMLRCSSSSPTGPFAWIGDGINAVTAGPTIHRLIDASVYYEEDDGSWWYVADTGGAPETTNHINITAWQLDPATDHTTLTNDFVVLNAGSREAPVLFKYDGYLHLITSGLSSYTNTITDVKIQSATTMAGLDAALVNSLWASAPGANDVPYVAQPTFALKPQNRDGVLLGFDRWVPGEGADDLFHSRHVWYPAAPSDFTAGVLAVRTPATWTLSELPSTASGAFGVFESPIIMGAY